MFDLSFLTIIGGAAVLWIGFVRLAYREGRFNGQLSLIFGGMCPSFRR